MHLEMDEMKELKSVLRSLVVSSPTQVNMMTLLRDFRAMMGCPLPYAKYGYRDPLTFLKERFGDCFLFNGKSANPELTLIVTENLKHIDSFVKSQRVSSNSKHKVKRRSVPDSIFGKPTPDLVSKTFELTQKPQRTRAAEEPQVQRKVIEPKVPEVKIQESIKQDPPKSDVNVNHVSAKKENHASATDLNKDQPELNNSSVAVNNFLRKRLPLLESTQFLDSEGSFKDSDSGEHNSDSGRYTSSSGGQQARLQRLRADVLELVAEGPGGVPCRDLIKLHRERYGRELDFARFGYTSIASFACTLAEDGRVRLVRGADGDWALVRRGAADPPEAPAPPPRRRPAAPGRPARAADPEDALPGIEFDPDVFPEDCMHFMESVPPMSLDDLGPGAMFELILGEVYSPSHFWFIRLGEDYNIAMEEMMDEMTRYYGAGEGAARVLAAGALRVGHYCASLYEGDWHRALIVSRVDDLTVKVRHVDYGTVDTVAARALKPLRREWARLPAQALRGRLAGARPAAAGRRWPRAAAAHFLRLVRDTRFVGNVVALDAEENIVELYLVDTSTETDVRVDLELIRAGHADPRPDSALSAGDCYLYPRFDALESGATPNYAEIHAYLRDGIALEYVPEYRRHVPGCLPADYEPRPAASPPPLAIVNRVPLFAGRAPSPDPSRASSADSVPAPSRPSSAEPASSPVRREPRSPPTDPPRAPAPALPEGHPAAASPADPPTGESPPSEPPPARPPPPAAAPAAPSPPQPPIAQPWQTMRPRAGPPWPRSAAPPMLPLPPLPFSVGPLPFYPAFAGFPPPCAPPGLFPLPAPPFPRPPCPAPRPPAGEVTLSAPECEIFRLLTRVDPNAAHWYMVDAIERAAGGAAPRSALAPEAREFRVGPPPGFGGR